MSQQFCKCHCVRRLDCYQRALNGTESIWSLRPQIEGEYCLSLSTHVDNRRGIAKSYARSSIREWQWYLVLLVGHRRTTKRLEARGRLLGAKYGLSCLIPSIGHFTLLWEAVTVPKSQSASGLSTSLSIKVLQRSRLPSVSCRRANTSTKLSLSQTWTVVSR